MPVLRKRNLGMGWLWSACAGLEPASPHYAMRYVSSYTIGTISRCFAAYPLLLVESCPTLFDFHKPMLI